MQAGRKIRLPVSVVVNGSHHRPPLTVDRKSRNMGWPQSHECPLQTITVTRVQPVSVVTERVNVHYPNWLHNLPLKLGEHEIKYSAIWLRMIRQCYVNNMYVFLTWPDTSVSLRDNQKLTCCASSRCARASSTFSLHRWKWSGSHSYFPKM